MCSGILNCIICLWHGVDFLLHLTILYFGLNPTLPFTQVFTTGIMDSLSVLQSRVVHLEDVVDRLADDLIVHREERSSSATSKLLKQAQFLHSPRLSTCTPRPSIDIRNRQPSSLSLKNNEAWEENALERSLENTCNKQGSDIWATDKVKINRNPTGMDIRNNPRQVIQRMVCGKVRNDPIFGSASSTTARKSSFESKNSLWKRVKGFLRERDLDSAYGEALCSGDELVLMELFDRTGPVLECLSSKTVGDVLSTLASYLLEQKFTASILPWLQQASLPFSSTNEMFQFSVIPVNSCSHWTIRMYTD